MGKNCTCICRLFVWVLIDVGFESRYVHTLNDITNVRLKDVWMYKSPVVVPEMLMCGNEENPLAVMVKEHLTLK